MTQHNQSLAELLVRRGFVFQHTGESLEVITEQPRTLYLGIDPTADSLHVGHLMSLMMLRHFSSFGHKIVVLIGGGTATIGDPSGKSEERVLLEEGTVGANTAAVSVQISKVLGTSEFTIVNNIDWLGPLPVLGFLRDIGKYFSLNEMIRKESVRRRIEDPKGSISFTEFSYSILQAFDFYILHHKYGCDLQIGGSDQWGNITAGIELLRKKDGVEVHGITIPLLVNSVTGKKFGKTEDGAIWLDAQKTTPYKFYQFWMKTDDKNVPAYLHFFTTLSEEDIDNLSASAVSAPELREAQARLAFEVTTLIHGHDEAVKCKNVSHIIFGGDSQGITKDEMTLLLSEAPSLKLNEELNADGMELTDVLIKGSLASSKREARNLIESGGVSLNGQKIKDQKFLLTANHLKNDFATIRKGKRDILLVYR